MPNLNHLAIQNLSVTYLKIVSLSLLNTTRSSCKLQSLPTSVRDGYAWNSSILFNWRYYMCNFHMKSCRVQLIVLFYVKSLSFSYWSFHSWLTFYSRIHQIYFASARTDRRFKGRSVAPERYCRHGRRSGPCRVWAAHRRCSSARRWARCGSHCRCEWRATVWPMAATSNALWSGIAATRRGIPSSLAAKTITPSINNRILLSKNHNNHSPQPTSIQGFVDPQKSNRDLWLSIKILISPVQKPQ